MTFILLFYSNSLNTILIFLLLDINYTNFFMQLLKCLRFSGQGKFKFVFHDFLVI
jgi:hypothetical protein